MTDNGGPRKWRCGDALRRLQPTVMRFNKNQYTRSFSVWFFDAWSRQSYARYMASQAGATNKPNSDCEKWMGAAEAPQPRD
jgi:hypothetical protein